MNFNFNILSGLRATYALRYEPEELRRLASAYWRIMLAAAFTLLVVVIAYGEWTLSSVLHEIDNAAASGTVPPAAFDRAKLKAVISAFDARQKTFEDMRVNLPTAIADPAAR